MRRSSIVDVSSPGSSTVVLHGNSKITERGRIRTWDGGGVVDGGGVFFSIEGDVRSACGSINGVGSVFFFDGDGGSSILSSLSDESEPEPDPEEEPEEPEPDVAAEEDICPFKNCVLVYGRVKHKITTYK
jgi:hypothetical protein